MLVKIDVPESALENAEKLREYVVKEIAFELYRQGVISGGKVRQLTGLSVLEFFKELKSRNIYLNYDKEELFEDLKTLEELKKKQVL
jgi:predicted HTH domain antitoxin